MPERIIPTVIIASWAAGLALMMQLGLMLAMGIQLRFWRFIGGLILSAGGGAVVAALAVEVTHASAVLAASIGAVSGILPAVILPVLVFRTALKKLGVSGEDFDAVLGKMRNQMEGGLPDVATPAAQEVNHV